MPGRRRLASGFVALAVMGATIGTSPSPIVQADTEWHDVAPADPGSLVGHFLDGWATPDPGSTIRPLGYRRGADGTVRLRGLAMATGAPLVTSSLGLQGSPVFQLPCSYRPSRTTFASAGGGGPDGEGSAHIGAAVIEIRPDGDLLVIAPEADIDEGTDTFAGMFALDLQFDAEAPRFGSACDDGPARILYVGPTPLGDDDHLGTDPEEPLASLERAAALVRPGDQIHLLDGDYELTEPVLLSDLHGTSGAPITITAAPGADPVISGSMGDRSGPDDHRSLLRFTRAEWVDVVGLEITGGPWNGIECDGCQHTTFRSIDSHGHEGAGLALVDLAGEEHETHDVAIIDSDLHHNHDILRTGGEADGLAIFDVRGSGVTITGTRLFDNSDDGLDLSGTEQSVTITRSWAFRNGVDQWSALDGYDAADFAGNGNGFKLGGPSASHSTAPSVAHVIVDSAAWSNGSTGISNGGNAGDLRVFHNTAWDNAWRGFQLPSFGGSTVHAANNLSIANRGEVEGAGPDAVRDLAATTAGLLNSWSDSSVSASLDDLVTSATASAAAAGPRAGSALPATSLLHLVSTSDLIDAAPPTGDPDDSHATAGIGPDYGAFEVAG